MNLKMYGYWLLVLVLSVPAGRQYAAAQVSKTPIKGVRCIPTKLPLSLQKFNFKTPGQEAPAAVARKVNDIVTGFYREQAAIVFDEAGTVADCYYRTLRAGFDNQQLYIVLLRAPVTAYCHARLFLYDPTSKQVSREVAALNLSALYSISDRQLFPSNLKKHLHIDGPEVVEGAAAPQQLLLLSRLNHNGTYDAVEEVAYRRAGLELDSVAIRKKVIAN